MNTVDLASYVADATGISKNQSTAAVSAVFAGIETALRNQEEVKLGSVGRLMIKVNKAHTANSFGGRINVPERRVVRFKMFGRMREVLNPVPTSRRKRPA